jgi:hypothetical protein
MIEVFNLAGDDQVSFMPVMGTLWAVAYCHCECWSSFLFLS